MRAILFYKQLRLASKLGTPKPDVCFSGVRGVHFDKLDRAWVARWGESGMQRFKLFGVGGESTFSDAYSKAVKTRMSVLARQHQFVMQRHRWKNDKAWMGTNRN